MASPRGLERYEYTPLLDHQSTRVLILEPAATRKLPIKCHLTQINLDTFDRRKYSYEALSYVWGATEGMQEVICEGKMLLVTRNCEAALKSLRLKTTPRILWVDAICIDQQGDKPHSQEKNHHIRLMGRIYHAAEHVLVWLGECDPVLAKALGILSTVCKGRPKLQSLTYLWPVKLYEILKHQIYEKELKELLGREENRPSLKPLIDHPWALRIWTVQEVAFARDCLVHFDDGRRLFVFSWSEYNSFFNNPHICDFAWEGSNRRSAGAIFFKDYMRDLVQRSLATEKPTKYSVDAIASSALIITLLEASNTKDKAYAVFPIFESLGVKLPEPDYNKPVNKVYEEFTRSLMEASGTLVFLQQATRKGTPSDGGLPSWVPDWSVFQGIRPLTDSPNALYGQSFPLTFPYPGQVEIFGTSIGHIHRRTQRDFRWSHEHQAWKDALSTILGITPNSKYVPYVKNTVIWREWVQFYDPATPGLDICDRYESFLRLLMRLHEFTPDDVATFRSLASLWEGSDDCGWNLQSARKTVQALQAKDFLEDVSLTGCTESTMVSGIALHDIVHLVDGIKTPAKARAVANLYQRLDSYQAENALFCSEQGHWGTCFFTAKPNDVLVIFNATKEPYVLREEGDKYRVISTAFIPTMIDLEAPFDEDISKMQKFTLF